VLEPQPLPVDQYLAERARYGEARSRGQQKIDQLVVGGAAGALTLSVTFLHDIAPHPLATSKCWLLLGWGSLGVALVLSFASHWTSANAFSDCIKHLDDDYAKTCYTKMPTSVWTTATVWFNRGGMLLLALGLIALARFAYVNIPFTESPHLAANGAAPSAQRRVPRGRFRSGARTSRTLAKSPIASHLLLP